MSRDEGRFPAALCLAPARVPHTTALPPGLQALATSHSSLLNLCVKTWGSTLCRVLEHSPESSRVYCTEQEFLPGVVTKALNCRRSSLLLTQPEAICGWRRRLSNQASHLVQTSSFIFQGMNSCRVHLPLLLQKAPRLQNWASDTPKLNMWFFLLPLHREALFLLYGEEQDCTLSWRNHGQMFIF